jgi:hypothetical protein
MITTKPIHTAFQENDEVVLAAGTYQGTRGVFLRFRNDARWADITERNGSIRSHPVAWLAHFGGAKSQ